MDTKHLIRYSSNQALHFIFESAYINYFAPKDLKHTRNISLDFLKYVNSPVIFNFTFVIDRESQLLEDYATKENMEEFFEGFEEFIRAINTFALKPGYIDNV